MTEIDAAAEASRWLIAIRAVDQHAAARLGDVRADHRARVVPVDPFFFLIGLTYALTIVYALTLRSSSGTAGWSTCSWPATR